VVANYGGHSRPPSYYHTYCYDYGHGPALNKNNILSSGFGRPAIMANNKKYTRNLLLACAYVFQTTTVAQVQGGYMPWSYQCLASYS